MLEDKICVFYQAVKTDGAAAMAKPSAHSPAPMQLLLHTHQFTKGSMKIRFYHWWVYNLYNKFWTPILKENPAMVRLSISHMEKWLHKHGKPSAVHKQTGRADHD